MSSSRKSSGFLTRIKGAVSRDSGSQSTDNDAGSTPEPVSERRREQIRRAQRLHRQRKAEHSHRLNAEIADLRAKDATKTARIEHLENVVKYLSAMLNQHGIPHEVPPVPVQLHAQVRVVDNSTSRVPSQRLQIAMPSSSHGQGQTIISPALNLDDTQIGVDFILTLEHPCLYHHHEPAPNDEFMLGHSGMMQASIMARAPPLIEPGGKAQPYLPPSSEWTVPAEELERLLMFSNQLRLPDEITPVQAWSQIREKGLVGWAPSKSVLEQFLRALKPIVTCYGFGAVMEKGAFDQLLVQFTGTF